MNFNDKYNKIIELFREKNDIDNKREAKKKRDMEKDEREDKNTKKGKREISKEQNKDLVGSKKIDLITGEVLLSLIAIDKRDEYRIEVKYLDDAKFTGHVTYKSPEDAKRTYEGINTVGELLNYINIHAETDAAIFPALKILKKELIAIKRDLSEDEIADLALEFPV